MVSLNELREATARAEPRTFERVVQRLVEDGHAPKAAEAALVDALVEGSVELDESPRNDGEFNVDALGSASVDATDEPAGKRGRLVACADCHKDVSVRAASCPHCGAPAPSHDAETDVTSPSKAASPVIQAISGAAALLFGALGAFGPTSAWVFALGGILLLLVAGARSAGSR